MSKEVKILPQVSEFLMQNPVRMFIDGVWKDASDGSSFPVVNPGNGEVIANVAAGNESDVDNAVSAARRAFDCGEWPKLTVEKRVEYLYRLADLVEENAEILAQLESLDIGKPITAARAGDVPNVPMTIRYYCDVALKGTYSTPIKVNDYDARQILKPRGVAAFLIPWNYPFLNVGWNLPAPLLGGNTTVMKPSRDGSLTALYFCRLVEQAGFPKGVINMVSGYGNTAGSALAKHPGIDKMAFTGSSETGREIAAACGKNIVPVVLELGGKGAAVVFDDVDVKDVVSKLVKVITLNSGQVCCTASRWIVHEKIWDEFISIAREELAKVRIGYGMDEATEMGPVVSRKQMDDILELIAKGIAEGADPILPGGPAEVEGYPGGFYIKPVLLAGEMDNTCAQQEIFGPVAFCIKFKTEQEGLDIVHSSDYGLANSVWSKDIVRANRFAEAMEAGNSWINGHNIFPCGIPYGGCNLSGMGGSLNSPDTFYGYLRKQSIVRVLN